MNPSIAELSERVAAQATSLPEMYGKVDFSLEPERFTTDLAAVTQLAPRYLPRRAELLANQDRVARIKAYTMLGDVVADAYAALMPKYGFRELVTMLELACDSGVEKVPAAPPELARFLEDMERVPSWLDMELIEEGARIDRNAAAHFSPLVVRGALVATFMNKYSALPMALTGTLSGKMAARRAKETSAFFATTVMPGALARHGAGFKAAAKVRLMHSMVRFNILRRSERWHIGIYGIPVPQVDQMPAGLISVFLLAQKVLAQGRTTFTRPERARVELSRYRCFLLGLPEDLLADTPQAIVDTLLTRHATLRQDFDSTCAALVTATMGADLSSDQSAGGRFNAWLERGFSKNFFLTHFMRGDRLAAARVGVEIELSDYVAAGIAALVVASNMAAYSVAARIPALREAADRSLVEKLTKQLARYGHAQFTTDADAYRPATAERTTGADRPAAGRGASEHTPKTVT